MTEEFIINHLWQSSCFGLLASLLAFMLRGNSPKVRYWVWLSASLKFLVPWVLLVSLGSLVQWTGHRVASVVTSTLPDTLIQIAAPFPANPYAAVQTQAQTHWGVTTLAFLWAAGFIVIAFTRCRSWYCVRAMLRAGTPVKLPIAVPALVTPSAQEPGVVGFLKPVLVFPAFLLERLNPEQLEALLAHELSHVRRHDNLFAALHMGVEAIFWFHPLVWWIGSRMLEERELACDEEVLRLGCEPTDYARGILTVCEHYSEAPLACVSGVTGADIKKRLKTILRGTLPSELNRRKKLALAFAALAAVAVPIGLGVWNAPAAHAQSATPAFEVASVRPATPLGPLGLRSDQKGGPGTSDPGTFTCQNCPLRWVLADAYTIHSYDFAGPDWLQDTRFDFSAKVPPGTAKEDFQKMIANLLIERFKMSVHRETRQMDLYEMTVAKNGPKFKVYTPKNDPGKDDRPLGGPLKRDADGFPVLTPAMTMAMIPGHARVQSQNQNIAWFAEILSDQLRSPVHDATGLTATYDFVFSWSWDEGPGAAGEASADLINQLPAQLGLKLERKKGPVEVLVVDHMEKVPTAN